MSESPLTRRAWMARMASTALGAATTLALLPRESLAAASPTPAPPTPITVYKDPSCGCCENWVKHLRASGFAPEVHDRADMSALKDSLGVPSALRSCHTAVIERYVIEGHVPAADVKRLLATKPSKTIGLAVPGMPAGSPGMEMGPRADRYDVIAFGPAGATRVFAAH